MEDQSSTLTEYLPQELYREIALYLDPRKDVATLLSLSRVSFTLKIEGQRLLFSMGPGSNVEAISDIDNPLYYPPRGPFDHAKKMRSTYEKFLESIVAKPESLAKYVIKYDHFSTRFGGPDISDMLMRAFSGPDIDDMLMRALPLMHNLKSLSMNLRFLRNSTRALSKINSFQLDILSITLPSRYSSSLTRFLRSQMALKHIIILHSENAPKDAIRSFDGIFPSLRSVQTTRISFWNTLSLNNNIKALHLWGYHDLPGDSAEAIKHVKYLRFGRSTHSTCYKVHLNSANAEDYLTTVLSLPPGADLNIEVVRMHMDGDIHKTIYNFTERLAKLRILIAWEGVMCHTSKAIPSFFRRVAAIAFSRCSRLLYVIVPNYAADKSAYLYRRSSQSATGAGPVMEEHQFDWDIDAQSGPDWWVEWEDILSGKSTLSLTQGAVLDMSDQFSPDGLYSSSQFYTAAALDSCF